MSTWMFAISAFNTLRFFKYTIEILSSNDIQVCALSDCVCITNVDWTGYEMNRGKTALHFTNITEKHAIAFHFVQKISLYK